MPPQLPPLPRHDGRCTSAGAQAGGKKKKSKFYFLSASEHFTCGIYCTQGISSVHMVAPGYSEPLSAHPYFPQPVPSTMFSSTLFPSNMFASSTVPSVYFPQPASLNLLACISLSLSLSTSQPANLFALLNLRELTRIIYRPTLATLWDLNLLTPFRSCSSDKNETNG